ncbi:MAG TPA: hypothetical protein VGP93_17915 [Polyangiaceae bacterium]|jgi:hypothetical protein|nr:hypothetical protein [Polyangiaceae bacterium]
MRLAPIYQAKLFGRLLIAAIGLTACAGSKSGQSPDRVLSAYSDALREGRAAEAYALLSDDAKKSIPFESFQRILRENPDEIRELAAALNRRAGPPRVTARVTSADGQSVLMVYEDGAWHIDGSAIDLYSQTTPETAVLAFVRAFENHRYDVLLRFVPDAEREGLDEARLRKAWEEGEQRVELERLTQALKASLPTARFEVLGERATMAYGSGGTIELVREQGLWKLEDLR